jgi:hypothetical protein
MRSVAIYLCVLILGAAVGLACGSDLNSGGGSGSVSLERMPDELAGVYCGRIFNCCDSEDRAEVFGDDFSPSDEGECSSQLSPFFTQQSEQLQAAVDAGRVKFNSEEAAKCLDHMKTIDCSAGLFPSEEDQIEACERSTEGQVEAGDDCSISAECKSDRCMGIEYDDNGEVTQMGTCGGGGPGQSCEWSDECDEGNYCEREFDPETGESEGTCRAIGQQGDSCSGQDGCSDGLYCHQEYDPQTGEPSGTCEVKGDVGDSCSSGGCTDDAFCEIDPGESSGTCAAKKSLGEPCQWDQCAEGSYCDSDDTQTCKAHKDVGEACSNSRECQDWCGSIGDDPNAEFTCQSDTQESTMCTGG